MCLIVTNHHLYGFLHVAVDFIQFKVYHVSDLRLSFAHGEETVVYHLHVFLDDVLFADNLLILRIGNLCHLCLCNQLFFLHGQADKIFQHGTHLFYILSKLFLFVLVFLLLQVLCHLLHLLCSLLHILFRRFLPTFVYILFRLLLPFFYSVLSFRISFQVTFLIHGT